MASDLLRAALMFALCAIASYIAWGVMHRRSMWRWITLYWVVLVIKCAVDTL